MAKQDPGDLFDYSKISKDFAGFSRPTQRALIMAGIFTPVQLARRTREEVKKLHGVGPASLPLMVAAMKKKGLGFKKES